MQTLKSFLDQSLLIWKDSTAAARFGIALLLVIGVGAIVGVGFWSAQPNYIVLADNLNSSDATKMIAALDAVNIDWVVKGSGSRILVDDRKWEHANIAVGDLRNETNSPGEIDSSPFEDPNTRKLKERTHLEKRLAQTIALRRAIEKATVHLNNVTPNVFHGRHRETPTASVSLTIAHKAKFNDSEASSIASLVASAVSGLVPANVSISDTEGRSYTTDQSNSYISSQEEYRHMRQRELAQIAESMLTKIYGFGKATVAVNANFSFPNGTERRRTYDKDGGVIESEKTLEETVPAGAANASGTAGSASNFGEGDLVARGGTNGPIVIKDDRLIKHAHSWIETSEAKNQPKLESMSVAVLIDRKAIQGENAEVPAGEIERITAMVSHAVGLDDSVDKISVDHFDFVELLPMEVPAGAAIPWDQINNIVKNLSLGLAAVIAWFVALKAFKKMQPDPSTAQEQTDRTTQVSELGDLVKENPEVFSKIIESWSTLEPSPVEQQESRAA